MERATRILCLLLAFLHFQIFSSQTFHSSSHLCLPDQMAALLEFKSTISVDVDSCETYPKTNAWSKSIDCCSWEGVSCNNMTGHVIGIDLSNSCLNGSLLTNNSLFQVRNLHWLDLSSNRLHGSPLKNSSGLFQLQRLQRLNLADNNFNGSISSELFTQLVSLTHLNLSRNELSVLLPYQISLLSNLVSLDLRNCELRFDALGFDMLARNLTKLRNLVLDYVDMSGVTVTSFLNLSSSLQQLSLRHCHLHGEFPSEVFSFPYLQHIDLNTNYLKGYLPKTNLSSALMLLNLGSCRFNGPIPALLGNLPQINFLDLSVNSFVGKIPKALFNLAQVTLLDLSHNQLNGSLPDHVSGFQLLEKFSLSYNSLSGGVPSWLFTLPSLKKLYLSHNNLTGPIDRIPNPSFVLDVDLSYNKIQGPIPNSFFDLVNISSLDLSANNLSGVIKSNMLSKLRNLSELHLSNNKFLSMSTSVNQVNYSFPRLTIVEFSSCSLKQFPYFLQTSGLEQLDLSNNNISGGISKWEAQGWEYLTMLNLSFNFLTTIERLPGKFVQVVDLHSNLLQGPILLNLISNPPELLSSLIISGNQLTGNIPSLICNCSFLLVLDLSNNSLSGTIPECLGDLSSLHFLYLEMNNLSGKIPGSIGNNRAMTDLLLDGNQLEGFIPRSLSNCSKLEVLHLGNNKLNDTFPHWLASLPSLEVLILRVNRLHGSLPKSVAPTEFSALRIIDLSRNEFIGPLPTTFIRNLTAMHKTGPLPTTFNRDLTPILYGVVEIGHNPLHAIPYFRHYRISVAVRTKKEEILLGKTLDIFVAMDFSSNNFSGQIPEELGELVSLQMLNLSHNNFTGQIPASFGKLTALESLDLSSNSFGGRIPSQLTNLTFLEVLNMSDNNLVGPIPNGNQFGTFDNDSYSGNLGLCGFPLSKQCGDLQGPNQPPFPKSKEGEDSGVAFIWKLVMMGYGCGLVLGLSTGYIVFTTARPCWFVKMVETYLQRNVTRWIRKIQGRIN